MSGGEKVTHKCESGRQPLIINHIRIVAKVVV